MHSWHPKGEILSQDNAVIVSYFHRWLGFPFALPSQSDSMPQILISISNARFCLLNVFPSDNVKFHSTPTLICARPMTSFLHGHGLQAAARHDDLPLQKLDVVHSETVDQPRNSGNGVPQDIPSVAGHDLDTVEAAGVAEVEMCKAPGSATEDDGACPYVFRAQNFILNLDQLALQFIGTGSLLVAEMDDISS